MKLNSWWIPVTIVISDVLVMSLVNYLLGDNGQSKFVALLVIQSLALLGLLGWFYFASGYSWLVKRRITMGGLLLVSGALFGMKLFGGLQLVGFTGDTVPIFEWQLPLSSPSAKASPSPSKEPVSSSEQQQQFSYSYPQFLGPNRNAKLPDLRLFTNWDKHPPQLLWRIEVQPAWSAFAIWQHYAITQEQQDTNELVSCYHLTSGKKLWQHSYQAHYHSLVAGDGPRATPTIFDNRVYTMGATGILHCLDLRSGEVYWRHHVIKEHNSQNPNWGNSCSPLIWKHWVIVCAGGEGSLLVAYDRITGELIWKGGNDRSAYSSPYIAELDGKQQIITFNNSSVIGHRTDNGDPLWRIPWPDKQPNVSQPVVVEKEYLFVSSGYGVGASLYHIHKTGEKWHSERQWKNRWMKAKFTNVVYHQGYIYGLDEGILVCLEPKTGRRQWKRGRYGHGQLILVGDTLLIQAESGEVVLVKADPKRHHELARFPALHYKTWNSPALAGPYLLVRNDREAACYYLATYE